MPTFVMWHEARRQERVVKGMIVDYRKRAERRRNYYEKTKQDPTQFLQVRIKCMMCSTHTLCGIDASV